MRSITFILIFFLISLTLAAQHDHDCISGNDIFLVKSDSVNKSRLKINLNDLRNISQAQLLFGKPDAASSYHAELFDENFTDIVYINGLKLVFSDTLKNLFSFSVTTINYTLVTSNGNNIRIGMSAEELSRIFPKSYSAIIDYPDPGRWQGKSGFRVYFCLYTDNKVQYSDACLVFILSEKAGVLEDYYIYVPG